ncbi:MAG: hypothetical protein DWQ37_10450 [Planctomycetota bacterium]|nr:MAG: hypothetical protein DWQ37_10450 [Planctomycetota bacterium]
MSRFASLPLTLVLAAVACPCLAQEPRPDRVAQAPTTVVKTPEMWIYEQERIRYEDPAMAVRRRAELRGAQRAARLAAMKWYGISNSRPTVSPTPWLNSSYAPFWGSNTYDPNRWRAYTSPTVVMQPETYR